MWKRFIMIALILEMAFSSGCIFEPRTPEPPGQGDEDPWVVPNSAKDVFLNLASGFSSQRDSNYERSLDPSFTFDPRDADVAQLGAAAFANWTVSVELEVLKRIKTLYVGARTIQFGDKNGKFEQENIFTGWAEFQGSYMVTLDRGDGSEKETYAGIARFTVVQGTKGYVLTKWDDIDLNGNYPTSGALRGTLRASN